LHSRLRYFDPERRRPGLPPNVGALVEKLGADSVTLTLVNTNPVEPRTVVVQAGGYGEHQFLSAETGGRSAPVQGRYVKVRMQPGCGGRLELKMKRYANQPSLARPWDGGRMPQ
jgi:hypothetical protein